jgi:hypothetical protein
MPGYRPTLVQADDLFSCSGMTDLTGQLRLTTLVGVRGTGGSSGRQF